jgi:hypothetical protein
MTCYTDAQEYESDCVFIENTIKKAYTRELKRVLNLNIPPEIADVGPKASPMAHVANMGFAAGSSAPTNNNAGEKGHAIPSDNSPNLAALFHQVFEELHRSEYPKGKWLAYNTHIGLLLYGMLISIKMKRHVEECTQWVIGTKGWNEFEVSRRNLMSNILYEINGNHVEL